MSTEQDQIKELVRERYGARAERVISLTPAELENTESEIGRAAGRERV